MHACSLKQEYRHCNKKTGQQPRFPEKRAVASPRPLGRQSGGSECGSRINGANFHIISIVIIGLSCFVFEILPQDGRRADRCWQPTLIWPLRWWASLTDQSLVETRWHVQRTSGTSDQRVCHLLSTATSVELQDRARLNTTTATKHHSLPAWT